MAAAEERPSGSPEGSGISEIQRLTPAWARGVPWRRWWEERGVTWDKAAIAAHYEALHAERRRAEAERERRRKGAA